jgi:hypothetical protein
MELDLSKYVAFHWTTPAEIIASSLWTKEERAEVWQAWVQAQSGQTSESKGSFVSSYADRLQTRRWRSEAVKRLDRYSLAGLPREAMPLLRSALGLRERES